jgi:hypothetical protein
MFAFGQNDGAAHDCPGTALLSGLHRTDSGNRKAGAAAHLAAGGSGITRLTSIRAGSVLHFTEVLIHSAMPARLAVGSRAPRAKGAISRFKVPLRILH